MNTKPLSTTKVLSVFMLTMINIAAICSLRNLPLAATYGFSIIFVYILGALLFLIPSALVSAELATAFHETGGIFLWVEAAFGPKIGFLAIWMQFVENMIWFPALLSFAAATISYLINPDLVQNKYYMVFTILVIFWLGTYVNLKGMKVSGWISTIGAILGTLIPGIFIICLAIIWWSMKKPLQIQMSIDTFLPHLDLGHLVFIAGILFSFAGMEMSAVHAREVQHPNKNFPKAIFISAAIIVSIFTLGSLAVAFVIPNNDISLVSSVMAAFSTFFTAFNIPSFTYILAFLVAIGTLAQVNTWLIGPVKGIYATAEHKILPPFLDKTNKKGVPYVVVLLQAVVVSCLLMLFFILPDVNSVYWLLSTLAVQLYLVMYLLLFASGIYLRFKRPDLKRPYKVFGDRKIGICIVGSVGFLTSLVVFFLGFIPPTLVGTAGAVFHISFLVIGVLLVGSVPFWAIKVPKLQN